MRTDELAAASILLALIIGASSMHSQGRPQPAMRFADMDTNSDRRISRGEWHGSDASFKVHDWNGDGVLSGDEVRVGAWRPVRGTPPADDRITREEAAGGAPPAQEVAHRQGYERGLIDGREAAVRDRANGLEFNPDARPELSTADAGFRGAGVTRFAYQAGYRDGFRRGYREAYSPR